MVIQVPGSVLFVASLLFREGTDWTSWLAYAVTGGMQGALLVGRDAEVGLEADDVVDYLRVLETAASEVGNRRFRTCAGFYGCSQRACAADTDGG
jgi:hypothetical protein